MSRQTKIADLLRSAAHAQTLDEQIKFVREAESLKIEASEAKRAANEWRAEDAFIRDTLTPGRVHELTTTASDWLTQIDTSYDQKEASREMVAEAAVWFGLVSDEAKSYPSEYNEQARGVARKLAGRYGDEADVAERAFLDETTRLHRTAVRSGLITVAADDFDPSVPVDSATPDDDPDAMQATGSANTSPYGADLYSNLLVTAASDLPEVGQQGLPEATAFPATNGVLPPEATSSNRAPALQELQEPVSQDVVPVNDPGLEAGQKPFPVVPSPQQKEAKANMTTLPRISDISKFAASGLDQIDQVADAKDNPSAPGIPFPTDVAYPWVLNPAQQVPAAINQAEQQIAQRNEQSPLLKGAGRDNSGWIGDNGARGIDYPGDQAPTGDVSTSVGYTDPVYGNGGDQPNQPLLPYGHDEANDVTNNPGTWVRGEPTQDDQGWREVVSSDKNLAAAYAYINQRYAAHKRQS